MSGVISYINIYQFSDHMRTFCAWLVIKTWVMLTCFIHDLIFLSCWSRMRLNATLMALGIVCQISHPFKLLLWPGNKGLSIIKRDVFAACNISCYNLIVMLMILLEWFTDIARFLLADGVCVGLWHVNLPHVWYEILISYLHRNKPYGRMIWNMCKDWHWRFGHGHDSVDNNMETLLINVITAFSLVRALFTNV